MFKLNELMTIRNCMQPGIAYVDKAIEDTTNQQLKALYCNEQGRLVSLYKKVNKQIDIKLGLSAKFDG